jgi:D-alanine-D-alanine ligase
VLGCRDFSRTDIRLRADGAPFVLEINPLPGLSAQDSSFPMMAAAAGIPHAELIQRLVALAAARYGASRLRGAGVPPDAGVTTAGPQGGASQAAGSAAGLDAACGRAA